MGKTKGKFVLVLMESLAKSGHHYATTRLKIGEKLEQYKFDPWVRNWVIYREKKKIKTLKD